MWNKTIVNLLQLSNFLTSCRLLHQLWDFSKNILLFNKSFVKKYSQTIFFISLPFYYCVKVWGISIREENKEGKTCQWVINLSIACCQWMGSVIFFFFIWSPALPFCRKQNWKGNPCEPCQHPRVPPDPGWGSEGLCCTSAKLPKCKGHSALPWDPSVSITYTDKAEESFSLRQMARGLRNKNVKKRKNLRLSSETGALVWRHTDRQATLSKCIWLPVWQGAHMGHNAGCAVWLICLGLFLLCSLRKHLSSREFYL